MSEMQAIWNDDNSSPKKKIIFNSKKPNIHHTDLKA